MMLATQPSRESATGLGPAAPLLPVIAAERTAPRLA